MTPDAKEFITPLTLSTLSKNPVYSSFTSDDEDESEDEDEDEDEDERIIIPKIKQDTLVVSDLSDAESTA